MYERGIILLSVSSESKENANYGAVSGGKGTIINEPKFRIMSLTQSPLKTIVVFPPTSKGCEAHLALPRYLTGLLVRAVLTT